jgi:hypothetical protein
VNGAHKRAINQSTTNGVKPFHEYKS